jgi:hypothetical protein
MRTSAEHGRQKLQNKYSKSYKREKVKWRGKVVLGEQISNPPRRTGIQLPISNKNKATKSGTKKIVKSRKSKV